MAAGADNEDVYATTDAAWMTEASDADERDAAAGTTPTTTTWGNRMRATPPLMTR